MIVNKSLRMYCISILSLFLLLFCFEIEVEATPKSVTDCIKEADCEPSEETPVNKDKESSKLVNEKAETTPLWLNFIKLIIVLVLILGLIYAFLMFLKKKNAMFHQVKALENLGGISVGQNKSLQIVRVGSKFYLIGVGDNVELLQEIDDEVFIEELTKDDTMDTIPFAIFRKKKDKKGEQQQNKNTTTAFKKQFMNELDKLKENRNKMIQEYKQKEDQNE